MDIAWQIWDFILRNIDSVLLVAAFISSFGWLVVSKTSKDRPLNASDIDVYVELLCWYGAAVVAHIVFG